MKVGDLVHFGFDRTVGIVVEIRKNGDCTCLFEGQIYLVAQSSLKVLS